MKYKNFLIVDRGLYENHINSISTSNVDLIIVLSGMVFDVIVNINGPESKSVPLDFLDKFLELYGTSIDESVDFDRYDVSNEDDLSF